MTTLALEFSSPLRSAAVLASHSQAGAPVVLGAATDEATRMAKPLGLIERALEQASVERESVERLIIGLGPGSYTGIRSAIAVGQGWQLARPVQLLGLSSAECLGAQAHALGWFGKVFVVLDAQRNEFYLASFEISSSGWKEIEPLRLASMDEAQALARTALSRHAGQPSPLSPDSDPHFPVFMIGPEVTRWFPEGRTVFPEAAALGRLAQGRSNFVSGEQLEPIYLRETSFVKAPPPRIWPHESAKLGTHTG